ncbi:MAG: hypothetical protein HW416_1917 [Chloroflexi bacterium]|nr:hypothetical protein [Chloroflexota bacterium]
MSVRTVEIASMAAQPAIQATGRRPQRPSGVVASLEPESPAARAGLFPGDRLLAVDGFVPRDIIDVRMGTAAASVTLDVEREGSLVAFTVEKELDEDLGIEFEQPVFDRMKTCNNACDFCFIRGLPPGLRRSLYIKDDDFRLSFLYGNFITLTNLSEAEWRRLLFQRLSPLRVSVHATDLQVRRDLLENPNAPPILDQIDELGAHGIRIHAQIVLMPGRNDGAILEQTIDDLIGRHPSVESAAVVPIGLTTHSHVSRSRALAPEDAAAAVTLVASRGFVYASDELYLLAGKALPSPRSYDDYPQLQNGVGLVQLFRAEWKRAARRIPQALGSPLTVCWVTGSLTAPLLKECAQDLGRVERLAIEVAPIQNSLFGGNVTVAGLVPANDVIASLKGGHWDRVILPRSMFDIDGQRTIDGTSPEQIAQAIGVPIAVASSPRELIDRTVGPIDDSWAVPIAPATRSAAREAPIRRVELLCAAS